MGRGPVMPRLGVAEQATVYPPTTCSRASTCRQVETRRCRRRGGLACPRDRPPSRQRNVLVATSRMRSATTSCHPKPKLRRNHRRPSGKASHRTRSTCLKPYCRQNWHPTAGEGWYEVKGHAKLFHPTSKCLPAGRRRNRRKE